MLDRETVEWVIDFIQRHSWDFHDDGREYNECRECGWTTLKDRLPQEQGLRHKPGCKIPKVLAELDALRF